MINFCEKALGCVLQTAKVPCQQITRPPPSPTPAALSYSCHLPCQIKPAVNYYMLHAGMGPDAHGLRSFGELQGSSSPSLYCNTLQHTATHCNTMQHSASSKSLHSFFSSLFISRACALFSHSFSRSLARTCKRSIRHARAHTHTHTHTLTRTHTHTHTHTLSSSLGVCFPQATFL